jgi:hypothetical protein
LEQDVRREDPSHHVFDAGLLLDLMNHHAPEDLHGGVANSDLMACAHHLKMGGALQNELDALLALNCLQDVKDEKAFVLFHPLFSPSRFLILFLLQ